MEPWQSWALAVGVGGSLFWYYTIYDKNGRAKKSANKAIETLTEALPAPINKSKQKDRPTKKSDTKPSSTVQPVTSVQEAPRNTSKQSKKRTNLKATFQAPDTTTSPSQDVDVDEEGDSSTTDWAKQLLANKTGVSLSSGSQQQQRIKTQRINGNATKETDSGMMPSAGDVSDMLEAPRSGPSVLSITGQIKDKTPRSAAPAQEQQALSKKQRQRQKRKEAEKAQADADEQQRRVLMEQQRRGAREARGEPAKNGLGTAQVPSSSAWSSNGDAVKSAPEASQSSAPLLDTFEQPTAAPVNVATRTAGTSEPVTSIAAAPNADGSIRDNGLPDEEEQIRLLTEQDGWEEVPSKTSKKNKKKAAPSKASSSPEVSEPSTPKENKPMTVPPPRLANGGAPDKQKQKSVNNYAALQRDEAEEEDEPIAATSRPVASHPLDSDWAV